VVVPVGPGTRVRYLVNLLSVPQDPDVALTNNKVLPEQGGSVLTSLLLMAARNSNEEEEEEGEDFFFRWSFNSTYWSDTDCMNLIFPHGLIIRHVGIKLCILSSYSRFKM
jgi:hypothetical protein